MLQALMCQAQVLVMFANNMHACTHHALNHTRVRVCHFVHTTGHALQCTSCALLQSHTDTHTGGRTNAFRVASAASYSWLFLPARPAFGWYFICTYFHYPRRSHVRSQSEASSCDHCCGWCYRLNKRFSHSCATNKTDNIEYYLLFLRMACDCRCDTFALDSVRSKCKPSWPRKFSLDRRMCKRIRCVLMSAMRRIGGKRSGKTRAVSAVVSAYKLPRCS